jgi:CRP-like cAMP-binding protein
LSEDDYARLAPDLKDVYLTPKQVLAVPDETIRYVYFPRGSVVSLVVAMQDGRMLAGAIVGNEGLVGLGTFLSERTATELMVVQIAGHAARMSSTAFHQAVARTPSLQTLLYQYSLGLMQQLARTAACNRLHSVHHCCARWLLLAADLSGRLMLPLTHEGLASLMGVRRASISEAAAAFQRLGLIEYSQGQISILDRDGLAAAACEDYQLSRQAYDQMYQ